MNFSYLPCIKCDFLTDLRNKTITCYTFSVRPTILEFKNVKSVMKRFDKEEENEDFCEEEYFNFGAYFRRRKNVFKKFLRKMVYL